ncbi:LysE family transporter [Streptomyces sp. NBC_01465]|uniref:LysE family transporter n=1 Tax=Streptomyces sp. NBC_01465 TaxID=2903878 RepID=UPI002E303499|nr:LysE family transporter [Streptomyces sp. NBC_01465]
MGGALGAGLLAGYGIAIPVGAVGAYLVGLTARTSWRTGACAALGVATADGVYALIATAGGSSIAPVLAPVMDPLRWVSAVVLIVLAVRGGAAAVGQYRKRQTSARAEGTPVGPGRAYLGLLGMTLLNPTTVIYFAALVLGSRSTADPGVLAQVVFVAAAFAASASWQLLLAGGGTLLGRVLTSRRGRLGTALASSALILALAVRTLSG